MAVHAKKIGPQGSGNFITADGNIAATDLQFTLPSGEIHQHQVTKIERIVNYTGGNITVAGTTFAPGTWDFSVSGGFDLGGATTSVAISGGLVTLR